MVVVKTWQGVLSELFHTPLRVALWASRKGWIRRKKFPAFIVGVGNLTLGGSGKTPGVAWLAQAFLAKRKKVVIVSSGYRRESKQLIVVKPDHTAKQVGDEPLWLAHMVPGAKVIVGEKMAAIELACREGADVVVVDDGFQRRWQIDFNAHVVMAREAESLLRGAIRPFGWVRERWAQIKDATIIGLHADAVSVKAFEALNDVAPQAPVFSWRLSPVAWYEMGEGPQSLLEARRRAMPLDSVRGKRVYALAGIAYPERFLQTLAGIGAEVVGQQVFGDHHWYTHAELEHVAEKAMAVQARWIVTTEKDAVRLVGMTRGLRIPIAVMAVSFMCENGSAVLNKTLGLAE